METFRSDDDLIQCLPHLHTLSVDQVQISEWSDIVALTKLPCLHALRIYTAPLLKVGLVLARKIRDERRSFRRMEKMNDSFCCWVI